MAGNVDNYLISGAWLLLDQGVFPGEVDQGDDALAYIPAGFAMSDLSFV